MTTETKRDLHADLALCEATVTCEDYFVEGREDEVVIVGNGGMEIAEFYTLTDAEFYCESREGWPVALRRAIIAEAENERLRAALAQIATYGGIDMRGLTCAQAAKDALESTSPIYDDVTESHRWLKALVSALDDGRIQQTRLSSGTDYVILGAREHLRKLSTEGTADVD